MIFFDFYRVMLYAERDYGTVCRLSVRPSVRQSVSLSDSLSVFQSFCCRPYNNSAYEIDTDRIFAPNRGFSSQAI